MTDDFLMSEFLASIPSAPVFYLSRTRLRRDAPANALAAVLAPADPGARLAVSHRLLWTLFPGPDEKRDFLWREDEQGRFLILSRRVPEDAHNLFELMEPRVFAPNLKAGDRLGFALRANAVVSRRVAGGRSKRCDPVAERLRDLPKDERVSQRYAAVVAVAAAWLAQQGERHGFCLDSPATLRADDRWLMVPREHKRRKPTASAGLERAPAASAGLERAPAASAGLSILDMEGCLKVTDPERFVPALTAGFGKARAFGCGLMLIRRMVSGRDAP